MRRSVPTKRCWPTVRRLLENGANTSFVNRIADNTLPIDELVADPVAAVEKMGVAEGAIGLPHPKIPLPRDLYGDKRVNSAGLDLANEHRRRRSPAPCSPAPASRGRLSRSLMASWAPAAAAR